MSSRIVFLDTETTGLMGGTGTVPFLVGLAFWQHGKLNVEQYFLQGLGTASERPMLHALAERLAEADAICSFNGKSYDWPLLKTRYVLARMKPPAVAIHLDLLHACRRLAPQHASHRLTAMEGHLLDVSRHNDLPGSLIPERYFRHLAGDAKADMPRVVLHNQNDIVALVALLVALARRCEQRALAPLAIAEHVALARVWAHHQEPQRALDALNSIEVTTTPYESLLIGRAKSELLAAMGEFDKAARTLERAVLGATHKVPPVEIARAHVRLAKWYEHRLKAYARAIPHALRGGSSRGGRERKKARSSIATAISRQGAGQRVRRAR